MNNQAGYADLLNRSIIDSDALVIGTLNLPNLDPNSVTYIDINNNLEDVILGDGQVLIGSTGNPPVGATLTGTTDEINVTNGPGSITLSTPQAIATTSSPTFNNLTLTSLNGVSISDYIITPSTSDLNMNSHSISNLTNLNGTAVSNYIITPSTQDLNMNSHEINHLAAIRPVDTNVNIGNSTSLPLGGIGNIVIGDFTTATSNNCVCIGLQNVASGSSVAIGKETVSGTGSTVVGFRSSSFGQIDSVVVGRNSVSSGTSADVFGVGRTNSITNSLLLGNGSYTNIRANSTCDLGTSSVPFQNIYSNSSLIGPTYSRSVDNVVSNAGGSTGSNICTFSGTTGKVIQDSGISSASLIGGPFLPLAGGTMSGPVNMGNNDINGIFNVNFPGDINIYKYSGAPGNILIGRAGTTGSHAVTSILINATSSEVNGPNQIVIGSQNSANTAQYPIAIGSGINSNGFASVTIGGGDNGIVNPQAYSVAIGSEMVLSSGANGICIGKQAGITGGVNNAISIGSDAINNTASSCLLGDSSIGNIRPNNTRTCDLGVTGTNMFKNIYASGSLFGSTFGTPIDNIVSCTAASVTSGNVVTWSGTSGRVIQDSGASLSQYLPLAGGTMSGPINMGTNLINNVKGMTFTSGTTLGGTACIINIDNTFARGNYLRNGGNGRNIGVMVNGPHFMSFNADYDSGVSNFKYNSSSVGVSLIRLDGNTGHLQYAASGTAGNTFVASDAIAWGTSGNVSISAGDLSIDTAGKTLKIKQGSNACAGVGATLSSGTVTVNTTAVATGDIVLLSCTGAGGTQGIPRISAISSGTSFTITSSSGSDSSTYSWVIVKAA